MSQHLTDEMLHELVNMDSCELATTSAAEHLSKCTECMERYTEMKNFYDDIYKRNDETDSKNDS